MTSDIYAQPEPDSCRTCGNSEEWHAWHKPLHPFNDGSAGAAAFLKGKPGKPPGDNGNGAQRGSEAAQWPFDPVLRQALINKGVLTSEDLRNAEEQIRAVTAQFEATVRESRGGQSAE